MRKVNRCGVAVACAILAACGTPDVSRLRPGQPWTGVVDLPGAMHKHVSVTFRQDGSALLDVPSARTRGLEIERVRVDGDAIELVVPLEEGLAHRFAGTIGADAIRGRVTGMPVTGTFTLLPSRSPLVWPAPRPAVQSAVWPGQAWERVSAPEGGIDERKLAEALAFIESAAPDVRAVLVVRHGRIAVERYFHGASAEEAINGRSVTKSVVSAAIGVALREGLFRTLDERLTDVLPERTFDDSRKRRITLRHLANMTAGLTWQENGPTTVEWIASSDSAGYVLQLPLAADPGTEFRYNSGLSHLLSAALTRRAGIPTRQYVEERVLHPIGARVARWDRDPAGYEDGASEIYLTARDMARFGYLYLRGGRWRDRQVVDAAWVAESTRPQSRRNPFWADYGYMWWLEQDDDLESFAALGYGGQAIWITPRLDLVIVVASTPSNPRNDPRQLIVEQILPAIRGSTVRCPITEEGE